MRSESGEGGKLEVGCGSGEFAEAPKVVVMLHPSSREANRALEEIRRGGVAEWYAGDGVVLFCR
jgi:hypothetical protein